MMSLDNLPSSLPKLEDIQAELARRNLRDFIEYTFPKYDFGWFNEELAETLTQFVQDVVDGKQPRLMIFAPPRSGKSEQVSRRLPAWALGKHPYLNIIASSYSADLANKMSKDVQKIMIDEPYIEVFGEKLPPKGGDLKRTQEEFDIIGDDGGYRGAGVGVGITGMGADIGIIDDPIKDAKEANSKTVRDAVWDWYTSTFYTRLSPNSGILLCMTRWHEDDLAGRLLKAMEEDDGDKWTVIDYPAIAEVDEKHRKKGEALQPSRYPLERLTAIKKTVGTRVWNALYQGKPTSKEGDIFKTEMLHVVDAIPAGVIIEQVRAWDFAATKGGGDYTVGVLMGKGSDGRYYILDVVRGQYSSLEVEDILKATASRDGYNVKIHMPQDPGATGKGDAQRKVGLLAGYDVKAERVNGDKVTRATGFAAQVEAGNVVMLRGAWNKELKDELNDFPLGAHDDQVDAASDAFNELSGRDYNMFDLF